jgi:hypothetical protein
MEGTGQSKEYFPNCGFFLAYRSGKKSSITSGYTPGRVSQTEPKYICTQKEGTLISLLLQVPRHERAV